MEQKKRANDEDVARRVDVPRPQPSAAILCFGMAELEAVSGFRGVIKGMLNTSKRSRGFEEGVAFGAELGSVVLAGVDQVLMAGRVQRV